MIALTLALCLAALPSVHQDKAPKSIYEAGLARPTGRNGYEEYLRAGKIVASESYKAYARWMVELQGGETPKSVPAGMKADASILDARDALRSRFGKALDLVRAGNAKPIFDPSTEADFTTLFDHLADFKSIARLGTGVAYSDFAHGRASVANDLLLDLLQFANGISGGNLISFLVGIACEAIVTAVYARHIDRLSVSDLAKVGTWVEGRLGAPPTFLGAVESELRGSVRAVEQIFTGTRAEIIDAFSATFGDEKTISDRLLKLSERDLRSVGKIAQSQIERSIQEQLRFLRLSEANWISLPDEEPEPPIGDDSVGKIADEISSSVIPLSASVAKSAALRRTQLRLLRLHALVLRYRWEHDRLPALLSDAVVKADLVDPITGQAFQYEVREGTYRLYSKGWAGSGEIELLYRRPLTADRSQEIPGY
ncbi:MAG TPA: hypothetical protein PLH94_14285 [Fimbriimonadaceae bacterium]|nr:hypothetical protein [Fimbriimonadaceae bacterium]